jgi:transcriptional regulator with GAF, ATPase, and Fis domain
VPEVLRPPLSERIGLALCQIGSVASIPAETMSAFQWYSWPGNIRELQNLVERAVILSRDGVLPNPLHKKQTEHMIRSLHRGRAFQSSMTLEDSDRTLIVETLEQVGWVVGGPRGAAAKLGLKRTTLLARMRRLKISRPIREETDVLAVAPASIRREDAHSLNDKVVDLRFLP